MSIAFIPARKRASERGAGAGIVSACSSVPQEGSEGSGDVFVEKLRDVEIWLLRCGFRDPALVAVDVDIGHGEGFGGETESISH